jgi:hypothetical protein
VHGSQIRYTGTNANRRAPIPAVVKKSNAYVFEYIMYKANSMIPACKHDPFMRATWERNYLQAERAIAESKP